ncbi:STE/STE20/TAO protein kinase [Fonticula alba]|uniref:non-specific serine/threonine protein kinase n=1 Tax=Fonticula alba TaxID=691883 RepID=A0A058Z312_FONAL|nr:STE/STE20/TAO protein kinase [Fonticula alba]KCV68684.1 STE/STE20/TAO protein kinase [Fonticula alba]|eukprot:XP_009497116.1 STE/STE20/TAO protein kinase [Fonticula alba]
MGIFSTAPTEAPVEEIDYSSYLQAEDPDEAYEILCEIGQGSFGSVYKARQLSTGEIVAIKKMSIQGEQGSESWIEIMKEIAFIATMNNESMVRHVAAHLKNSTVWLVMEFCMGSVSDVLEVLRAPLLETEISALVASVLEGLIYLHGTNRIHRDIKAANILLTSRGKVRLGDFGAASMSDPANTFIGTPCWMAPEVILAMESGLYTQRADIWSLGITCIELAEQKPPLFEMNTMSALYHIPQNPPPRLQAPERWSADFNHFVESCLQMAPSDRHSALRLREHPFISNYRDTHSRTLKILVRRARSAAQALEKNAVDAKTTFDLVTSAVGPVPMPRITISSDGGSVGPNDGLTIMIDGKEVDCSTLEEECLDRLLAADSDLDDTQELRRKRARSKPSKPKSSRPKGERSGKSDRPRSGRSRKPSAGDGATPRPAPLEVDTAGSGINAAMAEMSLGSTGNAPGSEEAFSHVGSDKDPHSPPPDSPADSLSSVDSSTSSSAYSAYSASSAASSVLSSPPSSSSTSSHVSSAAGTPSRPLPPALTLTRSASSSSQVGQYLSFSDAAVGGGPRSPIGTGLSPAASSSLARRQSLHYQRSQSVATCTGSGFGTADTGAHLRSSGRPSGGASSGRSPTPGASAADGVFRSHSASADDDGVGLGGDMPGGDHRGRSHSVGSSVAPFASSDVTSSPPSSRLLALPGSPAGSSQLSHDSDFGGSSEMHLQPLAASRDSHSSSLSIGSTSDASANDDHRQWEEANYDKTIKPVFRASREQELRRNDYQLMKTQLKELKLLQTQQGKFLKQLRKTHDQTHSETISRLEKEIEAAVKQANSEHEKLTTRLRAESDAALRQQQAAMKNFVKEQKARQKKELKQHLSQQKTIIKDMSRSFRDSLTVTDKVERRDMKQYHAMELDEWTRVANLEFEGACQQQADVERRAFAGTLLEAQFQLELRHFEEEARKKTENARHLMAVRLQNFAAEQQSYEMCFIEVQQEFVNQQSQTQSLEREQLASLHRKEDKELRKTHLLEVKAHPKTLKAIREQAARVREQALRQSRERRAVVEQALLENAQSKEERRLLSEEFRQEYLRVSQTIQQEHDQAAERLVEEASARLQAMQERQLADMRQRHERDREQLKSYQLVRRDLLLESQAVERRSLLDRQASNRSDLEAQLASELDVLSKQLHRDQVALVARHQAERAHRLAEILDTLALLDKI